VSDTLACQQQAMLQALWAARPAQALAALGDHAAPGPLRERGLRAYRSNARALAGRALQGAYPVVAQLLGEENFQAVAERLWAQHPPVRGDLAQWGAALPGCIAGLPDLAAEEPYLADVARLEWALHDCATLPDAERDPASFTLLGTVPPETFTLQLAPGARCMASPWPVASIVLAHLAGEPSLEEAGQRLRAGVAETAVVWRRGLQPRVRMAAAGEAEFIAALQDRRSLADSLQAAPALRIDQWLAPAVQDALVLAAVPLPPERGTS
jgi:hypothetical protein